MHEEAAGCPRRGPRRRARARARCRGLVRQPAVVRPAQVPAAHSRRHPVFGLRGRRARSGPARNPPSGHRLVERELRREGLPPATFGNLRPQELILAKTADRSMLGCMNDMAFLCEVAISDAGGLAHCDLGELNQALHRNINSSRGYRPPVELAAQRLERGHSSGLEQARSRRHPANSALGSPAGPASHSVAEHHPPEYSVAAVLNFSEARDRPMAAAHISGSSGSWLPAWLAASAG